MADTKDWTWVLEQVCPECGFDAHALARADIGAEVRGVAATFSDFLARPDVRDRPSPEVWSTLEYACHVRDVCRIMTSRMGLRRDGDDPMFQNWDQDATAVDDDYAGQDPDVVRAELDDAAAVVADAYDAVTEEQWPRPGRRSNGSVFTIESLGKYLVHDLVHHIWDVEHAASA